MACNSSALQVTATNTAVAATETAGSIIEYIDMPQRPDDYCNGASGPSKPERPTILTPTNLGSTGPYPYFSGIADEGNKVFITLNGETEEVKVTDENGVFGYYWPHALTPGTYRARIYQTTGCRKSDAVVVVFTVTNGSALPAPTIYYPAADSRVAAPVTFIGVAEPNATVYIKIGDQVESTTADASGAYRYTFAGELPAGKTTACVSQSTEAVEDGDNRCVTFTVV